MLRDLLISVASGLIVAVIASLFRGRRDSGRQAPTQTMTMSHSSGGGTGRLIFAFLLGAVAIFAVLLVAREYDPWRRGYERGYDLGYDRPPSYSDRDRFR